MADMAKSEAARELGVSERTIDRLRARGDLAWHQIGAKILIEPSSLEAYRRRRSEAALAEARLRGWEEFADADSDATDDETVALRRALGA